MPSKKSLAALTLLLALSACGPRHPMSSPSPEPEPAPAPPPAPVVEEPPPARPEDARSLWEQGTDAGRRGRWYDAERLYRQAAAADPASPTYHMALASALLQLGRTADAADAMLAGIRAEEALPQPNHRVLAVDYERLIQLYERLNRLDEARTARERQRFHRMMRDAAPPR